MTDRSTPEILRELVQDALDEGRTLKESLAQRSVMVITTSGVLVTLTLAVGALVTRTSTVAVPYAVSVCMLAALGLLFCAAILALLNNAPRRQSTVDLDVVAERGTTPAQWHANDVELEAEAHAIRVRLVADLRAGNRRRGRYLLLALTLECAALAALTAGTAWMVVLDVGLR